MKILEGLGTDSNAMLFFEYPIEYNLLQSLPVAGFSWI